MELHAFFDPDSLYTEYRSEFIPTEKLRGFYYSLAIAEQWNTQRHLMPDFRELDDKKAVPRSLQQHRHTVSPEYLRMPAGADVTPYIIICDNTKLELFTEGQFPISIINQPNELVIIANRLEKWQGHPARLCIFRRGVLDHLCQVTDRQANSDTDMIPFFLDNKLVSENKSVARIWASVADLDVNIDNDGDCTIKPVLPNNVPALPKDALACLLISSMKSEN